MTGRLDTIQAAVLNVKMKYFADVVAKREAIGAKYSQLLAGANVVTPVIAPGNTHVYAQYTLKVARRDEVVKALRERGIPCGVYYPTPCHLQPCFAKYGFKAGDFPVSELLGQQVVSLPMHPYLTDELLQHITAQVKEAVAAVGADSSSVVAGDASA